MRIGVPKEIKNHEYRVGMTPAAVRDLLDTVWTPARSRALVAEGKMDLRIANLTTDSAETCLRASLRTPWARHTVHPPKTAAPPAIAPSANHTRLRNITLIIE